MTLRPRDKVALAIVAGVLVIAAFYLLVLAPQKSQVGKLDAAISSQQQDLTQDQATYTEGVAARISLRKNRSEWRALRRAIPETADIPALLRVLQRSSDAAHVKMQSISLSGSSSTAAPSTSTAVTGGALAVPVSLTFAGSYPNIEKLMRELDGLVVDTGAHVHASGPLVSVGSVTLSGGPATLDAELTATIYELGQPAAAATSTSGALP